MEGRKAALLTLTYLGAVRSMPNYNVMGLAKASLEANVRYLAQNLGPKGIRVNGISAGPIKTLAAAGISGFGKILKFVEDNAPLRRNVTTDDVGNAAAFLMSDLAAGITGEITYVDAGSIPSSGGCAANRRPMRCDATSRHTAQRQSPPRRWEPAGRIGRLREAELHPPSFPGILVDRHPGLLPELRHQGGHRFLTLHLAQAVRDLAALCGGMFSASCTRLTRTRT